MKNHTFQKILILFFILFLNNFLIFSQTVNGKLCTEIDIQYLKVTYNYAELFDSMVT